MDEELSCACPHCGGTITFDEYGEPIATAQLEPNQRAGVRGIVVEEATPDWQLHNYHSNNQAERGYLQYTAAKPFASTPTVVEDPTDVAPVSEEELTDAAAVLSANTNDLKTRNLT